MRCPGFWFHGKMDPVRHSVSKRGEVRSLEINLAMKMTNKRLIILIIVLAAVAAGAAAWLAITRQPKPVSPPIAANGNAPTISAPSEGTSEPTLTPESVFDTSDWKTYRSEELGFEFSYPDDWKYVREGTNFVNMNPSDKEPVPSPRVKIRVWSNPENAMLPDFYGRLEDSKKIEGNDGLIYNWYELSSRTEDITVDGKSAVNFISPMGIVENTTVAIPIDKKIVEINFYYIEEITPKTIEGEIVDSLKFINTNDWRAYRSEQLGLNFQNPANFYLLDRLDYWEESILISDEEITFNEFLNGYFAPITISRFNQERDEAYINSLLNKKEEAVRIDREEGLMISGLFPEQPPHGAFKTIIVLFKDAGVTIRASEVRAFAGGKVSLDLESVLNELLSSMTFQ